MRKTIHWLNEEGLYSDIRIFCLFSMMQITVFQGEQVEGKCVCVCRGDGFAIIALLESSVAPSYE